MDTADSISHYLQKEGIRFHTIGQVVETKNKEQKLRLKHHNSNHTFDLSYFRNIWFKTSYLFDTKQSGEQKAKERYENYHQQSLFFDFLPSFTGKMQLTERKINAAIVREQGTNGDREMAYALYLAGFNVKDVHVSDLIEGREDLKEINMLVFPGGFANLGCVRFSKRMGGSFDF